MEDVGGFLTEDMKDMVISDIMNDVFLHQGRYPENIVLISQLEVCQEGGYLEDVGGFLTRDLEDRVILDTMDDLEGPQGSYPEGFMSLSNFVMLSQLEVCQEGGVKKRVLGGLWEAS